MNNNLNKPQNFSDQIINNKYVVKSKLKSGGFGSVYFAKDIQNDKKVYAIKFTPIETKNYAQIERKMYQLIEKQHFTNGFVKFYEYGEVLKHKYILMELTGRDLDELKIKARKSRFTIKTVLMIGLQVVDRLQALHKIGFIHRDVKPDNLAIGLKEKNKIIYLIDFGLAHKIGKEVPKEEKGKVIGTLAFMSCKSHQGKQQGPADDLESLVYTLLYLAEGTLPWINIQVKGQADFHKILIKKQGLTKKSFKNPQIPQELFQILSLLKKYNKSQKIDYLEIKFKLLQALKRLKEINDFQFDWCLSINDNNKQSLKKQQSPQSPRRKAQKMNEQNQQLIQNQIYQVYKFVAKNAQKKQEDLRNQKKVQSPNKKKQEKSKNKDKSAKKIRPASAVPKPKPQHQKTDVWHQLANFKNQMVSGPKIAINKI